MRQMEQPVSIPTYVPAVNITRITAKHTLGRLPITSIDAPEYICGMARRIGYTGRSATDLAIYRLKVRLNQQSGVTTLSTMFVVDDGKFIDYEQWQHDHEQPS